MGKRLGQNFLVNPDVAKKTADLISPSENDRILEIGSGKGFLTSFLVDKGAFIAGIEIDQELVNILKKTFTEIQLMVINADFLSLNIDNTQYNKFCGNIPYNIAGKIIEKILLSRLNWTSCILMLPAPVAARIVAVPGTSDYSAVSVLSNTNCTTKKEFAVNKEDFEPVPRINSNVVSFIRNHDPEPAGFYKMVKGAFSQKRKKIKNSISTYFGLSESIIKFLFTSSGISPDLRAEDLSTADFKRLYKEFVNQKIM